LLSLKTVSPWILWSHLWSISFLFEFQCPTQDTRHEELLKFPFLFEHQFYILLWISILIWAPILWWKAGLGRIITDTCAYSFHQFSWTQIFLFLFEWSTSVNCLWIHSSIEAQICIIIGSILYTFLARIKNRSLL
jgi:hypothetical protein